MFRALMDGTLDILYLSPERMLSNGMMDRLARLHIALIAIDEAHCVSAWGHEFRPEFRALACLPERFPGVPAHRIDRHRRSRERARTSCTRSTCTEAKVFAASFHRRNLHIAASPKTSETAQLRELPAPP